MDKERLRDYYIKYNLPFVEEFIESWYPKPIRLTPEDINNTKRLTEVFNQALKDNLFYGVSTFYMPNW